MVRRMFIPTIALVLGLILGDKYAWSPHLRNRLEHHTWSSLSWLVLVFVALVIIAHSARNPHWGSVFVGLVLGIISVEWGRSILKGIDLETIGLIVAVLAVLAILTAVNVVESIPSFRPARSRTRRNSSASAPTAPPVTVL